MTVSWAVTRAKAEAAVQKIVEIAQPRKVILFGSYLRGETTVNSDLDILVVVADETINPRRESVKIRRALKDIPMPMDIVVVTEKQLSTLSEIPGLIYREALEHGEVVYDATG
jgi:predicted nucleotidyltransferase